MGMNGGGSSTSLAPGFRFHPTDEELVSYYLKRKVSGKSFRFDAISEIDVYKSEPWDLPGLSKLKSRDLEWYFFSNLDKKYGNGSRTNRATIEGYWKTTGKDRPVQHRSKIVGMKKTLVYHRGRAPRGERSNWVMHEYKLVDEVQNNIAPQEAFVLCRIFHKSGSGPKNGEQYGAPFVEEEWEAEDNEVSILPGETAGGEVIVADGSIVKENYLNQPIERSTPLLNIYNGDNTNFAETLAENESSSLTGGEQEIGQEISDEHKMSNLPVPEPEAVDNNYVTQRTDIISQDLVNYMPGPGEQSLDNVNNAPSDEGFYLEANDLLEPIGENSPDFQLIDEYIGDVNNDIDQFLNFDPSDMLDIDDILNDLEYPTIQNLDQTTVQPYKSKEQLPVAYNVEGMASSEEVMVAQKFQLDDVGQYLSFDSSDFFDAESSLFDQALVCDQNLDQAYKQPYAFDEQFTEAYSGSSTSSSEKAMATQNLSPDSTYSFMNQASEMLGNFPTSPAFASELPTEDIVAKLQVAMQSSSSPPSHLKAQKANRIRSSASHVKDNGVNWSLDKCGNVNLVFSFNLPDEIVSPAGVRALTGLVSRRMTCRAWLYVLFFAVMVFCISNKVDNCIYAR